MTPAIQLLSASQGRALWYFTRSTGIVALLLLTATVVIGVVASVGWTTERWPRFLSQTVHRNLSLLCLTFVGIHIVTTVSDGYVPIGFLDAVVPFRSPYRPIWVGLGASAFDLLLVVLVTSALRHRIGYASWRFVHWLAYLCWPIAMFHSVGSGSDASLPIVLGIDAICAVAVVVAVSWRAATGREFRVGRRLAAGIGAAVTALAIAVFAVVGPLRPGWSHRSGTSPALLAELARKAAGTAGPGAGSAPAPSTGAVPPSVPFTYNLTGTQSETSPDAQGNVQVVITLQLSDPSSTALVITLNGSALQSGGIAMSSGSVDLGGRHGTVTGLNGGTVQAQLTSPPETLTTNLSLDQSSGQISGTVSGSAQSGPGG